MMSRLARAEIVVSIRNSQQHFRCTQVIQCALFLIAAYCFSATTDAADLTSVWNGTVGNWTDGARWSTNPLYPNNGNGGFIYDATINSGTVTINQNATLEDLTFNGGTLLGTVSTSLNATGSQNSWDAGTIGANATLSTSAGSTLAVHLLGDKKIAGGTVQIGGTANWSGFGDIIATAANSNLKINAGGIFDIQNDETIYVSGAGSAGTLTNSGTLRKTGGIESLINGWTVNNTGTINVQTGSLRIASTTGSSSGNIVIAPEAGISFLGGNFNLTGSTITNNGIINIYNSVTINSTSPIAGNGVTIVNVGGNVAATNLRMNSLTVNGVATVSPNGANAGASKVESLTVGATGKLNLKDNDLVIGTGNVATTRTLIKTGKAGLLGITSDATSFGVTTGFGYAAGNDPKLSPLLLTSHTLSGQAFDNDSVLVKYTFLGDADLDGDSDLNDLGLWAQSFTGDLGNPVIPVTFWTSGDFDLDGDTDLNDLGFWAGTFTGDLGGGAGSLIVVAPTAPAEAVAILNGMGITVIPEPGTIGALLSLGMFAAICSCRRSLKSQF